MQPDGGNGVPLLVAFAAGLLSFLSPCVLPLIPSYVGFLTGMTAEEVQAALMSRMAAGDLTTEHKGKTKVFDLVRALPKEPRTTVDTSGDVTIEVATRIGPEGSLRPDVFVRQALAAAGFDVAVTSVTRTDSFIETEEGVFARPV